MGDKHLITFAQHMANKLKDVNWGEQERDTFVGIMLSLNANLKGLILQDLTASPSMLGTIAQSWPLAMQNVRLHLHPLHNEKSSFERVH